MTIDHTCMKMDNMTQETPETSDRTRFFGAEKTTSGREHQSAQQSKRVASAVLFLMAMAATFVHGSDVVNYISSFKSVRGLSLDIKNLEVIDDENPRAIIRFNVKNKSPLKIEVEGYWFDLYLAGKTIGRSYSMYRGTSLNANPGVYAKALAINKVLGSGESLDLEFELYIYPAKMETIRKIQPTGTAAWLVQSNFTVFLPYSRKKSTARLKAEYRG